jgi:hypothetical protein
MILLRYFSLLFFFQFALFAQTRLEREINRIKDIPGITLEYLEGDRLSVNYDGIKTRVFYIGDKEPPNTTHKDVPSFVFDISELDTADFNHLFYLWQEVPVASSFNNPTIGDLDNDGRTEIYGYKKDYFTDPDGVYCYEQDENGIFRAEYKYPENTVVGLGIKDVNGDGKDELHILAVHYDSTWSGFVHDQTFYKSPRPNSLATEFYFDYNIYKGGGFNIQLNDFIVGDFNNDGINEAIFYNFAPQEIWITKFNVTELTFDSLLSYPTWQYPGAGNEAISGFVINDFDMDNKTDIVYSSEYGNIYVLENDSADIYSINWDGNNGIWNSYINFTTDDIDNNGKPEFWVGGVNLDNGLTKLVCYENDGDNIYKPIAEIKLFGLAAISTLNGAAMDVDNDKIKELFVKVGNVCVILKFSGSPNNHNYEIFYYYKAEKNLENADMFILAGDNHPSIVMSMYESNNGRSRDFTRILKHHLVTNIKEEKKVEFDGYQLLKNYPNPFNPSTIISYILPEQSNVKIIVYNTLGEEIITLLEKTLNKGEHKIVWNGIDKNNISVPSGVYFISLIANNRQGGKIRKTIKSVLLK